MLVRPLRRRRQQPHQPKPPHQPQRRKPRSSQQRPVGNKLIAWQIKLFTQPANDLSKQHLTDYAKEKGWEVDVSDMPTDLMPKLMVAIESGDVPDLIQLSSEVAQLYGSDALADVTSVVKELEAENGPVGKLHQGGAMFKGKWWGIPWFMYADAWFARKDIFATKGIKPEELKTFEQRRDAALEVSDPSKEIYGWGSPIKSGSDGDNLARHQLNAWGASVADESGEKVVLDSPAAVEAVKWVADIFTNPKYQKMLAPGIGGWNASSNNEHYLGGKIALTNNASSIYWAAKSQNSPHYPNTVILP